MRIMTAILLGAAMVSSLSAEEPITDSNWLTHPAIKRIRSLYSEINDAQNAAKLLVEKKQCDLYGGSVVMEGELYRDPQSLIRKYVIDGGSEDSRERTEYYYDTNGVQRFTYKFQGAVNGTEVEERIYYDDNGKHLYTNRKEKGPGYTQSNLGALMANPHENFAELCNDPV